MRQKRTTKYLRDMDTPTVLGYELSRITLTPIRKPIIRTPDRDYGADPIGDGNFRMMPSGDIVTLEERNKRLE